VNRASMISLNVSRTLLSRCSLDISNCTLKFLFLTSMLRLLLLCPIPPCLLAFSVEVIEHIVVESERSHNVFNELRPDMSSLVTNEDEESLHGVPFRTP
jgi:hypothetical protein